MTLHLQREIENLKKRLLSLSAKVEQIVRISVDSIGKTGEDTVQDVLAKDDLIDRMEVEVEEECLKILALHQPVAIDLRFIIAVLKINNDLERMGDLAVNIVLQNRYLGSNHKIDIDFDFTKMSERVQAMLSNSLDALVNLSIPMAQEVRKADDEIDDMLKQMYQITKDYLESSKTVDHTIINLFQIARNLERIADLATNVAEDVIYMIEGKIVRHPVALNLANPKDSRVQ